MTQWDTEAIDGTIHAEKIQHRGNSTAESQSLQGTRAREIWDRTLSQAGIWPLVEKSSLDLLMEEGAARGHHGLLYILCSTKTTPKHGVHTHSLTLVLSS